MFFSRKKETKMEDQNKNVKYLDNLTDVDPIAEADVYLAYGRNKQAMEILNEALEGGKISQSRYDDFIENNKVKLTNNDKSLEEEIIKNIKKHSYSYYISFTAGNNNQTIRKRLFVDLLCEINTKNGIKELENIIEHQLQEIFSDSLSLPTWTIDSYIEIFSQE